jgi:hypothetical protein
MPNMILSGGTPAARARLSSPRHHVGAGASFASVLIRLVGIRLHHSNGEGTSASAGKT